MTISRRPGDVQFGSPPEKYDQAFFQTTIRDLQNWISALGARLAFFPGLPGSGYGLKPGQPWADTEGRMYVVQPVNVFSPSFSLTIGLGHVTVT